jgi:hypothetical protein
MKMYAPCFQERALKTNRKRLIGRLFWRRVGKVLIVLKGDLCSKKVKSNPTVKNYSLNHSCQNYLLYNVPFLLVRKGILASLSQLVPIPFILLSSLPIQKAHHMAMSAL